MDQPGIVTIFCEMSIISIAVVFHTIYNVVYNLNIGRYTVHVNGKCLPAVAMDVYIHLSKVPYIPYTHNI